MEIGMEIRYETASNWTVFTGAVGLASGFGAKILNRDFVLFVILFNLNFKLFRQLLHLFLFFWLILFYFQ